MEKPQVFSFTVMAFALQGENNCNGFILYIYKNWKILENLEFRTKKRIKKAGG